MPLRAWREEIEMNCTKAPLGELSPCSVRFQKNGKDSLQSSSHWCPSAVKKNHQLPELPFLCSVSFQPCKTFGDGTMDTGIEVFVD